MKKTLLSLLLIFGASPLMSQILPYQNPALTAEERAQDLVSRLTLEEKVSLMMDKSPAIPRLGIPQFHWWNEALHGVARNGTATVFPITMLMASTWNDELVHRIFTAVSDEARAKAQEARLSGDIKRYQSLSFWTPNINIFRDPRWGRGQETYGEDPYLTGRMGLAVVRGLQGMTYDGQWLNPRYKKLLACAKHFAVHSGPESTRHSFDIRQLPERDLWETYLPAFKTLVEDGQVAEVMCAYQRLEGEPCCGNARLEQHILRDDWGFRGLITSDCGAVADFLPDYHNVSKDKAAASSKALLSGTDVECGSIYKALPEAVKRGDVSEEQIDISLRRLMKARIELGDFDPDSLVEWTKIPMSVVADAKHKALALEAARQGTVLLKNNGVLPLLSASARRIVVMGPNANDSTMMWGNYNGFPTHTVTILEGLRKRLGDVRYVRGCDIIDGGSSSLDQVMKEVGDAETVVFVGGITPRHEGEELKKSYTGFYKGDRTDLELPAVQRRLLRALSNMSKRVVLVVCSGSAIALEPEMESCDAIVQAWYGGEKGGDAVAEILLGEVNPSGKMPVTVYRSVNDLPAFDDYTMANRTYRYFKGEPLFPFGYGLSYTTFELANVICSVHNYGDPAVEINCDISNKGQRDGTEVIQVYVRNINDKDGPQKSLCHYQRVSVKAGESRQLHIALPHKAFEGWDAETNTVRFVPGKYQVMIGTSSADRELFSVIATIPR